MPALHKVCGWDKKNSDDTLVGFLKSEGLLEELIPLNSKGRAEYDGKLLKEALKHWFVPTDLIRQYYGEGVAMYYSWMNFLISKLSLVLIALEWLVPPSTLAVLITVINYFLFKDSNDSPLNSVYSMFVALWATLFVIFWKRRCRGLFIEWDNHTNMY